MRLRLLPLAVPACQDCGACCAVYEVDIEETDWQRLPHPRRNLLAKHTGAGGYPYEMRRDVTRRDGGGRCRALAGTVGQSVRCSVYHERPDVCREFKRGGWQCKDARIKAGLEVGL